MYIHSNNEVDKRINVSKIANDISVLYLLGRKQQMLKLVQTFGENKYRFIGGEINRVRE